MFFRLLMPVLALLLAVLVTTASPVHGEESDNSDANDLFSEEPVVTTARTPRPASHIAENITVITADDITRLNAHTLADVLNTVPGFQFEKLRTPGSFTDYALQGAGSAHVQVLIDGVMVSRLLDGQSDPGLIPVQHIERVEIIKGAASTAWGPALGGVINIITKSPDSERAFGGAASLSIGESFTSDTRGEVSGTINRFGYYLSGGNLHSDGLLPNNGINHNNAYGKFTIDLPKGNIVFGGSYQDASRGQDETRLYHDNDLMPYRYHAFLAATYPLAERLTLELDGRLSGYASDALWGHFDQGSVIVDNRFQLRELTRGGSAKVLWGGSLNNVVAGIDFDHGTVRQNDELNPGSIVFADRTLDRWGIYSNGALSLGVLTILPGIRFDHTGIGSDLESYNLGATYRLTEKTVLRAYGASGYSLPIATFNHKPPKVWTVQTGAETGDIPYVWLKGTLFYNDISDAETINNDLTVTVTKGQIKQGFEVEAKSVPLFGFSAATGYTYTHARDKETGDRLASVPIHSLKLALNYDNDNLGLRGAMTGNYVWWNAPGDNNGYYKPIIWDLHLTKKLLPREEMSPELFFSAHNLFDGSQYLNGNYFKNTPRWFEGGVRFKF